MDQLQDQDTIHLLSIFPEEMWKLFGEFVTDFRVYQTLRESSPFFASLLDANSFLERPSIHVPLFPMDNPKSRRYQYPPPYLSNIFTTLSTIESIQRFVEDLQSDNPFPGHAFFISLGVGFAIDGSDHTSVECSKYLMTILEEWGHKIWYVSFHLRGPSSKTYEYFYKFVSAMQNQRALRVTVNIEGRRDISSINTEMTFPHFTHLKYVKSFCVDGLLWRKFREANSELTYVDLKTQEDLWKYKRKSPTTNIYNQMIWEWEHR